jgi:hypothetical protein
MTLQEIKNAVDARNRVHWCNTACVSMPCNRQGLILKWIGIWGELKMLAQR